MTVWDDVTEWWESWSHVWSTLVDVWNRLDDNPLLVNPLDEDGDTPVCSSSSSSDEEE